MFARTIAAMCMSPKYAEQVIDGAPIDTGSNVLSSMGLFFSLRCNLPIGETRGQE